MHCPHSKNNIAFEKLLDAWQLFVLLLEDSLLAEPLLFLALHAPEKVTKITIPEPNLVEHCVRYFTHGMTPSSALFPNRSSSGWTINVVSREYHSRMNE
jgi:hypothetical protein